MMGLSLDSCCIWLFNRVDIGNYSSSNSRTVTHQLTSVRGRPQDQHLKAFWADSCESRDHPTSTIDLIYYPLVFEAGRSSSSFLASCLVFSSRSLAADNPVVNGWRLGIVVICFFIHIVQTADCTTSPPYTYSPISYSERNRCLAHSSQWFRLDPPLDLRLSPRRPISRAAKRIFGWKSVSSRGSTQV
jgi:hypothetical protein